MLALTSRRYLARAAALSRRARAAQRRAARRDAPRRRDARSSASPCGSRRSPSTARCSGASACRGRSRATPRFAELCAAIGEQAPVAMRYATSLEPASTRRRRRARALARALEQKRALDLRRGLTHAGPHRDDLVAHARRPRAARVRLGRPAAHGGDRAAAARGGDVARAARRARRCSCSTIRSPSSTRAARRASSSCSREQGMGQTMLAVPRESDIPRALHAASRVGASPAGVDRRDVDCSEAQREPGEEEARGGRRRARRRAAARAARRARRAGGDHSGVAALVGAQIAAVTEPHVDHGERNAVRAGDDERVDERAVAAGAGAVAVAEREARDGRRCRRIRWLLRG